MGCLLYVFVFLLGLVWPPLVVAQHRIDGLSWWQALLGVFVLLAVVTEIVQLLVSRRPRVVAFWRGRYATIEGPSKNENAEAALGWLATGTLFGTLVGLVLASLSGQAGLVPAGLLLMLGSLAISNRTGSGVFFYTVRD